jgi:hypothetical protein
LAPLQPSLPVGFRRLRDVRDAHPFSALDRRFTRTISDYKQLDTGLDRLVIARVDGKEILGLAYLIIDEQTLTIEELCRNASAPRGVGREILALIEDVLGPQLRTEVLLLEATNLRLRDWYVSLGFEAAGSPYEDPAWGTLFPMRKRMPATRS